MPSRTSVERDVERSHAGLVAVRPVVSGTGFLWPGGRQLRFAVDHEPDLGPPRPRALREQACHPQRELDVVRLDLAGERLGEPAEHVVGRGPVPLHPALRHAFEPGPQRLQTECHDRGREDREPDVGRVGVADQQPPAQHDDDVDGADGQEGSSQDDQGHPSVATRAGQGRPHVSSLRQESRVALGGEPTARVRSTALRPLGPVSGSPRRRRGRPSPDGCSHPRRPGRA